MLLIASGSPLRAAWLVRCQRDCTLTGRSGSRKPSLLMNCSSFPVRGCRGDSERSCEATTDPDPFMEVNLAESRGSVCSCLLRSTEEEFPRSRKGIYKDCKCDSKRGISLLLIF